MRWPKDILFEHYKSRGVRNQPKFHINFDVLYTYGDKIGEFFMLTDFNRLALQANSDLIFDVHAGNSRKEDLKPYLGDFYREPISNARWRDCHYIVEKHDCGSGNIIQQIYRACGLDVPIKPKGLVRRKEKILEPIRSRTKIAIHVDGYTATQTGLRAIDDNSKTELQRFINENQSYDFIEFGNNRNFSGTINFTKKSLHESVELASQCEYFIGVNSAFMHIAACFDCKMIVIVDNLSLSHFYLPMLKNENPECKPPYNHYDLYWLYPQAVHLHQKGENELVKSVSCGNISKAINGELYPFWDDSYLELINEF